MTETEVGQADAERSKILPQSTMLKTPQKHLKKAAFSLIDSAPVGSDIPKPYATRSFLNSNNDANYSRDFKHDVRTAYTNDSSQGVPKSVPNKEG